jgi:aspartate racemase
MKVVGIVGGLSWVASHDYYRKINEQVGSILGKLHSSKIILVSLDLQEYADFLHDSKYDEVKLLIQRATTQLQQSGSDFVIISSNTAHIAAPEIMNMGIPLLHIADCCALHIKKSNIKRVGFLGTMFSMKGGYIHDRLRLHGLEIFTPTDENELQQIQHIIETELSHNIVRQESKILFLENISRLVELHNVQGVILGCTEIPLLISQQDVGDKVMVFDSTAIHVMETVNVQLGISDLQSYLPQCTE